MSGMSMRGSGIYEYDFESTEYCPKCEAEDQEVEVHVNDWGTGYWTCPQCGEENERVDPEPDYEPEPYWPDRD